jgi:serine protease Do
VEYGFLGVRLPRDNTNRIEAVEPGTPAGEGGLQLGDEIVSIGGIPVVDSDTLVMAVNAFSPGTPIKLRIIREGLTLEKSVVLSKLRVFGEVIATNRPSNWRGLRVDFVSTDPRTTNSQALLKAMAVGGVVVSEVQPGSAAEDSGIKVGQIIIKVDGESVKNPTEFAKAVENLKGSVRLTTEGDRTVTVR